MTDDAKPRFVPPARTLAQTRAVLESRAELISESMASTAKAKHSLLVEVSHMARVAAERLEAGALGQGIGMSEIPTEELEAVLAILRNVQNRGHAAFLGQYGKEEDYQAVGRKVTKTLAAQRRRKRA